MSTTTLVCVVSIVSANNTGSLIFSAAGISAVGKATFYYIQIITQVENFNTQKFRLYCTVQYKILKGENFGEMAHCNNWWIIFR